MFEDVKSTYPIFTPWIDGMDSSHSLPKIILNILEIAAPTLQSSLLSYCESNGIALDCNSTNTTRIYNACLKPISDLSISDINDFDNTFLLDPYNPRISVSSFNVNEEINLEDFKNQQSHCRSFLEDDSQGICSSIQTTGFQRGNSIKVVSLDGNGAPYVILEGNTRMNAIRTLIGSKDSELLFSFSDVDVVEMSGFSYKTFYPLKIEILKTIHIAGVKPWGAYNQARVLQISRENILKDQPDLGNAGNETKLMKAIRNGSRLTPSAVKQALAAIDNMDRAIEMVKSDKNIDGYCLVDNKKFEDMYSYFEQAVKLPNVKQSIIDDDDAFWGFLINIGAIYRPYTSETSQKTIGRAENIRDIEKVLKTESVPDNWHEADSPKDTIVNAFTSTDEEHNIDEILTTYKASKSKQKPLDLRQIETNLRKDFNPSLYDSDDYSDVIDSLSEIINSASDDILHLAVSASDPGQIADTPQKLDDLSKKISSNSKKISLLKDSDN